MSDGSGHIRVTAFGKHPAWEDHLDLTDPDDALLRAAERRLMVDGLEAVIDGGGWARLAESEPQKLLPYAHAWILRTGGMVLTGRMIESRDSVGRSRYPFVLAARLPGAVSAASVESIQARLRELEHECLGADTRESVVAALERGIAEGPATLGAAAAGVDELAARAAVLSGDAGADGDEPCRVLSAMPQPEEGPTLFGLAVAMAAPSDELLVVWPEPGAWVDVFLRGIDGAGVYWIRRADKPEPARIGGVPEDGADGLRATALRALGRAGGDESVGEDSTVFVTPVAPDLGGTGGPVSEVGGWATTETAPKRSGPGGVVIAIIVIVVLGAIAAVALLAGGGP